MVVPCVIRENHDRASARKWLFLKWDRGKTIDKKIREWFSAAVLERVFPYRRWRRIRFWTGFFRLASLRFMAWALTGPKFGAEMKTVSARGSTVFILFDGSASMSAEDLKPNRLERSKILLSGLLEKMEGDRVGIIVFAGEPFVFCPLTSDLTAARQFLRSVAPDMVPVPGTRIGSAVRLALSKMPEKGSRAIILLTDGEDHKSDPLGAAEEAQRLGVKIFTVGIGNAQGEPIPIKDDAGRITGYKKDAQGKIILSKLDEATLIEMARETDGAYARAEAPDAALDLISGKLSEMEKNPLAQKKSGLKDRYQWALSLALLLFFVGESLEFFSVPSSVRFAVLILFLALPAQAASFKSKIAEGNKLYEQKKYDQALESYEKAGEMKPQDPRASYNSGVAQYRLKSWDESTEALKKSALALNSRLRSRALFNLGNAQFQSEKYGEAAQAYQESLKINPNDSDARENLRLALRFMNHPPPKQQNKSGDKEKKEGKGQSRKAQAQEQEKKENAKRILKGTSGEDGKPQFKPKDKNGKKKNILEDW